MEPAPQGFSTTSRPRSGLSSLVDDLIKNEDLVRTFMALSTAPGLLLLLLLWHVANAFVKRHWLLPSHTSRVLGLNAATLALLGIAAKPVPPGNDEDTHYILADGGFTLLFTVLISATIGAFMPSVAASSDLKGMWSNVAGVGLLVFSTNFIVFLSLYYHPDDTSSLFFVGRETAMELKVVMASLFLLFMVLLMQALALKAMLSDIETFVLQRLDQVCMEIRPGHKAHTVLSVDEGRAWSWQEVEHRTRIKLMMVLTSSPQSVMARSPCAAIVGMLVLLCILMLSDSLKFYNFFLSIPFFQCQAVLVCGFICVWRWVRVALKEDRPFSSLIWAAEPSYWCRSINRIRWKLKAGSQRSTVQQGRWPGFRDTIAFLMLCFIVPLQRALVTLTRLTHILSAMLVQKLICLPIRAVAEGICALCGKHVSSAPNCLDLNLGVVCLEGEDARIVGQEFAGAVNRIIKQSEKATKKSDLKPLVSQLESFKLHSVLAAGKSNAILDALHEEGAPYSIENLHVEHGYQFGWTLTVISLVALLAKIEVTILGESTISDATVNALCLAMDMTQLVDEQFVPCIVCTKETYASACASAWSKVQKKQRRWARKESQRRHREVHLDAIGQIMEDTMGVAKRHIEEFNKAKTSTLASLWSQQAIVSYLDHTLCKNLLRRWIDLEAATAVNRRSRGEEISDARKIIKEFVDEIHALVVEVLSCCLSNLPSAIDMSTTDGVQQYKLSKVKKGLVLVAKAKYIWEELQWPTLHSRRESGLGQLRQWMY